MLPPPPPPPPTAITIKIFHYCRMTAWARLVHDTLNIYVVRIQTVVYPALRIFTAVR
jgi:hypothetical protein